MQLNFFKLFIIVTALFFYSAPASQAQSAPTPARRLLALSKTDHTLAIVDPQTLKIIARIPVGPDPHEVVATPDGRTAYVSNTGSGRFHEINIIDLIGQKTLPNIDTGALLGPHGLVYTGGKLWFTAEGAKAVARYDPALSQIDLILGTGQNRTHIIRVAAGEKQVYMTNVDSGTVSILENLLLPPPIPPIGAPLPGAQPQMGWLQTVIPAGKGAEGFDVSPDEKQIWAANAHDATLTIIDLPGKKEIATVDTKVLGISRVQFTPDGKRVLISSLRTGELLFYDAGSRSEIKRLKLGKGAAHILLSPDGAQAFVSCTPDNFIAVVDLKTMEVTQHLEVGGRPDGLAWTFN